MSLVIRIAEARTDSKITVERAHTKIGTYSAQRLLEKVYKAFGDRI